MPAKKVVAEKNTVTATALEDLNIVWGEEVVVAGANTSIEVSYGLYDYLAGLSKVSGGKHNHTPASSPAPETVVEAETVTEEAK